MGHLELLPKIPCHTTWVSTEAAPCSPGAGSANTSWAPPALETLQAGTQSHVTHAIGSRLHTSSSTCLLTALPAPTQSCQGPFQIHILSSTTSRARVGAGRVPLGRGLGDFAELPGAQSKSPSYPSRMLPCRARGSPGKGRENARQEDLTPVLVARTTLAWLRAAPMAASSRSFSSFLRVLISPRKWLRSPLSWAFLVFA